MTRRVFTAQDRAQAEALREQGLALRQIAAQMGWSHAAIGNALRDEGFILNQSHREKLGAGVVAWFEANQPCVEVMRERMRVAWVTPHADTATLLALAEHVWRELRTQTGGRNPTMRAALYRMMGVYGAAKKLYVPLSGATATARKEGVFDRAFWAESNPLNNPHPGWWTAKDALRWRLDRVARPDLTLRGTGVVVGVTVEAAGQASGLEGAIERRLGYRLPVWPTGGLGALPRIDYIAAQMQSWAEQNDADEAVLFVVTDFDPTGLVIADNIAREVPKTAPGVEVVRLGIYPGLRPNVVSASATGEVFKDEETHAKSAAWLNACAEFGIADPTDKDACFQAEALDYATWADIIGTAVEERLAGRSVDEADHDSEFVDADRILAVVRRWVDASDDLEALADELEAR
jgi:hypothetical protein